MSDGDERKESPFSEKSKKERATDELIDRASKALAKKVLDDLFGTVDASESTSNTDETAPVSDELKVKRKEKPG